MTCVEVQSDRHTTWDKIHVIFLTSDVCETERLCCFDRCSPAIVCDRCCDCDCDDTRDSAMSAIFDHFLVLRVEERERAAATASSNAAAPPTQSVLVVTHKLSAPKAKAYPSSLAAFCYSDTASEPFPCPVVQFHPSEHFTFVLTEADGAKMYGFCRGFLGVERTPEVMCVLTRFPYASLFHDVLEYAHVRWILEPAAVFPLMKQLMRAPPTSSGSTPAAAAAAAATPIVIELLNQDKSAVIEKITFRRIDQSPNGASSQLSVEPLFEQLSVENVLRVFSAVLCEQRIVFVSRSLTVLSECVHAAAAMIAPLEWQHIFIPIVPRSMLPYVCAPMPLLVGVRHEDVSPLLALPIDKVCNKKKHRHSRDEVMCNRRAIGC